MPDTSFRPRPGNFGEMTAVVGAANVGSVTANTTTRFAIPAPGRKCYVKAFTVVTNVVPADADGTLTAQLFKYNAVTNAFVAITPTTDLETLVTKETRRVRPTATLADKDRIIFATTQLAADTLYVDVVSNSAAIDTQPTNLTFGVELAILE